MDLFDSYTVAARSLRRCCVKTLNAATDVAPEARALLKTEAEGKGEGLRQGEGPGIKATLNCPVCKKSTVIHADGRSVRLESR